MFGANGAASEPIYRIYEITLTDINYHAKSTYRVISSTAESAIRAAKQKWRSTNHLSFDPAPDAIWVNTGDQVDVIDTVRPQAECASGCKSKHLQNGRAPQHAVDG